MNQKFQIALNAIQENFSFTIDEIAESTNLCIDYIAGVIRSLELHKQLVIKGSRYYHTFDRSVFK